MEKRGDANDDDLEERPFNVHKIQIILHERRNNVVLIMEHDL